MHSPPASAAWLNTQRSAFQAKLAGRLPDAIDILSRFISDHVDSPVINEALALRSLIYEDLGDLDRARDDLIRALALTAYPSYLRFTLQLSLAVLDEQAGSNMDAIAGYLRSLETALDEGKTSVGTALRRLLALRPVEHLAHAERDLIGRAVQQSWTILGLPGNPDLSDLKKAADVLVEAQSRHQ
jgi:tetratricopeptide (TPR) repeat protein